MRQQTAHTLVGLATAFAFVLGAGPAAAQISDDIVKIGILNDMDGAYSDLSGRGSLIAAQMAVQDFGGSVLGKPIEVVAAGHQLKPDIGLTTIRRWFDTEKVDMVADIVHSSIALAAQELARQKDKVLIATAVGSTDFTGKACTPVSASWLYDTESLTTGLVKSNIENKLDTWYIIAVDYAFGKSMEEDARAAIQASGGKLLGSVRHPLGTADFSSYLLQAQASGAKVILLANGGGDLVQAIKQANEFGIVKGGQTIVTPLMFITDVKSLGLDTAKGLSFTTPFYWNRDEATRTWSKRFAERHGGNMPTMVHAAMYSSVSHYLKSVKEAGTDAGKIVVEKMRQLPVNDFYVTNGQLRVDGRLLHPMYLVKVKSPEQSKEAWDYYDIIRSIPGEQAFRALKDSACPLAKGG